MVGLLLLLGVVAGIALLSGGIKIDMPILGVTGVLLSLICLICTAGLFTVAPNQGRVLRLFGNYKGTARRPGMWFTNPFMHKTAISLPVRNFETTKLKVNDARSNPVEIGASVVWKVVDTAEASFEVNDYSEYVLIQSESVVRALASSYPYDAHGVEEIALSTHTALTPHSHRTHTAEISEGLVRALVVLCSDGAAQPVVNTGSLYTYPSAKPSFCHRQVQSYERT